MIQAGRKIHFRLPLEIILSTPAPGIMMGILLEDAPEEEGIKTLELVNKMVDDLDELNKSGVHGLSA